MAERIDFWRYHLGVAALAGGIALAPARGAAAAAVAAASAALLCARPRTALVCAVLVLAGAGVGELRLRAIDGPGERLRPFTRVTEPVDLLERPRPSGTRTTAAVRLRSGARVLAVSESLADWPNRLEPGMELRVRGILQPPRRADDSPFDWPGHLRGRGIAYELHLTDAEATGNRRGGLAGVFDSARGRAERAISAGLPPASGALLRGMVLGQDEDIDPLTKDDWRDSGLAHLLAVSGQNVMLLCALALPLLALAGASMTVRVGVLLALIALYVPLAGAGPSLQRAAVMGAAGLLALVASRPASAAYGLLLAAAVTLGINPRIASDPGWQLSFAAVIGILAARPLMPRGVLAGALWLTTSATLATAPLLAIHFQAVPLVSIPANLAALPAVAPVMWIGMLAAALGQLPGCAPVTRALGLLAEPLLGWLQLVAREAATLPHAVAQVGAPGPVVAAGAWAVMAGAGWAALRVIRGCDAELRALGALARLHRPRIVAAVLAALVPVAAFGGAGRPDELTVSFLDVGQGDATLVQGSDGSAVLFDGGRAQARVARLVKQAGVRRLGLVVATHPSADHHGGLSEVLRRIPVDALLENGQGTADPTYAELLRTARERGIPVTPAAAGQRFRVGELDISILSPAPRSPGPAPADPNPFGVVAIVSSGGFDLFLSADAESPALVPLDLPDVEAMKVPHHGSSDPGLPAVLERLRPEIAVIEVGEENTYGHPTPQTLRALEAAVPEVRRTDRDGTVTLTVRGGRMKVD